MGIYSYKLNKSNIKEKTPKSKFKENELKLMTTFQLREICNREKLVKSVINPLDKEELIRLIMRYRGEEESLLIESYREKGIERLQSFINKAERYALEENKMQCPAKITIYEGLNIEVFDKYMVNAKAELDEGNMLLVDENFQICAIFNLIKEKEGEQERYYLVKEGSLPAEESISRHYKLLYFEQEESELLYHIYENSEEHVPTYVKFYSMPVLQFEIKKVLDTDTPLAIDFGTSNTTAGIYVNGEASKAEEVDFVKVVNVSKEELEVTPLIPSIAGIKSVQEDKIEYIFGYEALKASKASYIDDGLSVFYDIKRWINDYEKLEKVIDTEGKWSFIKRKDIIKAYLEYVISLARQQFKCNFKYIHISSPAKQKYKFYMLFKEILKDYVIENENTLEEGAAVLYNTISELIESNKYVDGRKYKALIIDCGGGTTDLTSCNFTIYNNRISYKIDIETAYENGDTDFGGNNLTFRILQFIKILMAKELIKESKGYKESFLEEFDVDIFRYVDENGVLKIYETLNEEYEKAEKIIPTKFKEYEDKSKEAYYKVKSNYYFLFDLAEKVKKEFFNNPSLLKMLLTSDLASLKEERNKTLSIDEQNKISNLNQNIEDMSCIIYDKWKLSYMTSSEQNGIAKAGLRRESRGELKDETRWEPRGESRRYLNEQFEKGELQIVKEPPQLLLNVYEITVLLKADIYNIIKKFLEKLYEDEQLYNFSIIKLTGQSCKVEIFKEALKEFIPGKIIQFKRNKKAAGENHDLKLSCLRGSLKYLKAKKYGYANVTLQTAAPTLPYVISAYTHTGHEKVLIHSVDKTRIKGTISRFMERIVLKLYLKDTNNQVRYEYNYEVKPEEFTPVLPKDLVEMYPQAINQQETDSIINDEIKFFVWARQAEWGFSVVPVLRKDEKLSMGKEAFFSFENDQWETNFFDGRK